MSLVSSTEWYRYRLNIVGLSVDGGIDTSQKEIRVTAVKEGGSAHQHGFLKVPKSHHSNHM